MLEICNPRGHDEIVHSGTCPACEALAKVKEVEEEMSGLLRDKESLKQELDAALEQNSQQEIIISALEQRVLRLEEKALGL